MKIAYITAGAAGMYCGTCMHDNTLAAALMERGHEVSLTPTYTPMRTDENSVADEHIFFGAVNVYLQQKSGIFRHTPRFIDRLFDNRRLLNWVSRFSSSTNAKELGALTLSMLEGEEGLQAKELEKLVEWLKDFLQPEIVHLSNTLFAGFARRIRQELGVPVVCSLSGEDLFLEDLEEPYLSRILATIRERTQDIDAFTTPCNYYADIMRDQFGIPGDRIHLAPLGIRAAEFAAPPPASETSDDAPIVIGYLARICPEKGAHQAIEAFHLLQSHPQAHRLRLRVAGYQSPKDQAFFEEQQKRVEEWGLTDRVDFVGEVDRSEKISFLHSLDIFTMPTIYREPKGLPVLEALASGVPVVQPRHGAFPEWIENTGGGILVEPKSPQALADGIAELIDDPERRRALGARGRQVALSRFDEGTMADDMIRLYSKVLEQKSSGSTFREAPRTAAAG